MLAVGSGYRVCDACPDRDKIGWERGGKHIVECGRGKRDVGKSDSVAFRFRFHASGNKDFTVGKSHSVDIVLSVGAWDVETLHEVSGIVKFHEI